MNKQEAIWYVNHTFEVTKEELCNNGRFDEAKEFEIAQNMAIEALSAERTGEWIPVSERLPEDREDVLVYLSSARIAIASYSRDKLPFMNTVKGWGYHPLNGHIDFGKENVTAWQPLPEPYKGGDME